jgi:ABC-type transport system involved in cytochrome bd biosynthesis fused ATPase/permease subunit
MKKTVRTLTVLVMAVLMLTISTIPAMAAGFDSETSNNEITFNKEATDFITGAQELLDSIMGNEEEQQASAQNEMSNIQKEMDESWQQFEEEIKKQQEEWAAKQEEFKKRKEEREKQREEEWAALEREQKAMETTVIIIIVTAVLLVLAEIIYIFIAAPKCGMSRFWALVPLFSNFFGLIVFIVVRSNRKTSTSTHTVTCPTCSSVHPAGTTVCSICGTKLQ